MNVLLPWKLENCVHVPNGFLFIKNKMLVVANAKKPYQTEPNQASKKKKIMAKTSEQSYCLRQMIPKKKLSETTLRKSKRSNEKWIEILPGEK